MDSGRGVLQGRPHGGCAILWSNSLKAIVTPIESHNRRVCAVKIEIAHIIILLACVYLPVDTKFDHANLSEYIEALCCVSSLACKHGIEHVILGGDMNTDMRRHESLHTESLVKFMTDETLVEPVNRIDFTFESMSTGDRSHIDHFLVSENLLNRVINYDVTHDALNLSDHSPIIIELDIQAVSIPQPVNTSTNPKLSWRDASPESLEAYHNCLADSLGEVNIPFDVIECTNPNCTEHYNSIGVYCDELVNCISTSGDVTIPKRKISGTRKAGWNEFVRPFRDTSLFWHAIWKQAGSPRFGWVAQIRRKTRADYHKAIRQVKQNSESIVADRMASSLSSGIHRDLWSECRKINGSNRSPVSNIDGATTAFDIANVFASKYKGLYNSVSFDSDVMRNLELDVDSRVSSNCCSGHCYYDHTVSVSDLRRAVELLKSGKSDGNLSTDYLINAPPVLFVHLAFLFTTMIRHGMSPSPFTESIIIPIPKNARKSVNDSENYRGIALNSPFSKLFELVVLQCHRNILSTSDLQFGYKKHLSTTSCSFVVDEVVQEYINGHTDIHIMLLDASKAFDCVNYVTLFKNLISRGLCPTLCRILLRMHVIQRLRVRWNTSLSDPFSASNGVKQGGILSPILFTIYSDVMLTSLQQSDIGCSLGHVYAGALAYADDVILLAPSKNALVRMLEIARDCATHLDLKFNGAKSQYLRINHDGSHSADDSVRFCDVDVPLVDEGTHLGRVISSRDRNISIQAPIRDIYSKFNMLLSKFSFCSPEVRYKLFNTYCVTAYGSPLWNFEHSAIRQYYVAWRKCVRRVWGIPAVDSHQSATWNMPRRRD